MPRLPDPAHIRYVAAHVAAVALERAANSGTPLDQLVHDWFPDHDAIDLRQIARDVARDLENTRRLVLKRLEKLMDTGKAMRPGGP